MINGKWEEFEGPEGSCQIPCNAQAWQLYTDMRGVGLAARRLTAALKKAISAPKRTDALAIMDHALSADSKYGASDTEPRVVAERCLAAARGGDYSWSL